MSLSHWLQRRALQRHLRPSSEKMYGRQAMFSKRKVHPAWRMCLSTTLLH
nr:unnamed protein product [Callosobruchus chinensis]